MRTPTWLGFMLLVMMQAAVVRADIVIEWNQIGSDTLVANVDKQNPGMASRTMAMLNLALYDGLAMVRSGGNLFYDYGTGHTSPGYTASGTAAAAQAAYTVLSSIYPDQAQMLSARLASSMTSISDGVEKASGIALGTMIGQTIVQSRASDGFDSHVAYQPTSAPGHWQPDPIHPTQEAWGPDWGNVTPFSIQSVAPFMPPVMPELTSQEYAAAYNEVKELGAANSAVRTAEQTDIANFWAYDRVGMGTPMRLYNEALQSIAQQKGNTVEQNAEMFAKATVAMADAGIVAWNAKFEHDLWRPVTGIRAGDLDGNSLTVADPNWVPLGAPGGVDSNFTPPFPTYISGHATFGGALFETLKEFYGTDAISFTLSSDELSGMERSFTSLSQAMAENGRSRVYMGIHWNFDDLEGQLVGQQVARYVSSGSFVSAVPEPSGIAGLIGLASLWGVCGGLRRRTQLESTKQREQLRLS
jgi:hypothetical protein